MKPVYRTKQGQLLNARIEDALETPVMKAVAGKVNQFTSDLKNSGLQRLERRDKGVYENVTAPKSERFIDVNS